MFTTNSLHIQADDPIVVESSPEGTYVWVQIGKPGNEAVLHVADYATACNLADVLAGLAHVMEPTNVEEPVNTFDYDNPDGTVSTFNMNTGSSTTKEYDGRIDYSTAQVGWDNPSGGL